MEMRHLRSFIVLADELHFGRAAQYLNIVQPALSQQIQQLERELGVSLLTRNKRNVALTESGRAFLVEARRVLSATDEARRAAVRAADGESGRLRLGYVDLATWQLLPAILRGYRKAFPGVELTLREMHREPLRDALLRGDLDVAFFSLRENDGDLDGEQLVDDPLVVALPAEHALARRKRVSLASLAREPWVLFPRELKTQYLELVLSACVRAGFVPRVAQEAGQVQTLAALVSAGFGVSLVPSAIARAGSPGIVFRKLSGAAPRLPLHVVWRRGDLSPAARQFVNACQHLAKA